MPGFAVRPCSGWFPAECADDLAELGFGHGRVEHGCRFGEGEGHVHPFMVTPEVGVTTSRMLAIAIAPN